MGMGNPYGGGYIPRGFGGGGYGGGRMGMGDGMGRGPIGGIMSLLGGMGGMGDSMAMGSQQEMMMEQQQYAQQYPNQMGYNPQYPNQYSNPSAYNQGSMQGSIGYGGPKQLLSNGVKRILRHHVLYLLIVNMPTEEEMAEATKFMEHVEKAEKQGTPPAH